MWGTLPFVGEEGVGTKPFREEEEGVGTCISIQEGLIRVYSVSLQRIILLHVHVPTIL